MLYHPSFYCDADADKRPQCTVKYLDTAVTLVISVKQLNFKDQADREANLSMMALVNGRLFLYACSRIKASNCSSDIEAYTAVRVQSTLENNYTL